MQSERRIRASAIPLQKHKMDTFCSWKYPLSLSMYLPHTWGGEANLEEYYKTLKELDKNLHDVRQKYNISGIIAGMDAQVEVKPQQGPSVWKWHESVPKALRDTMNWRASLRTCSWSGLQSMESSLQTHSVKIGNLPKPKQTNWTFGCRMNNNCRSGKIIDYIATPIKWETRSTVARNCRAQNPTDHWPAMTYVRLPQKNEGWRYENNSVLKGR